MKNKIQSFNGFKIYFDQISAIFKDKQSSDEKIDYDKLTEKTGLNKRKVKILLSYLCDIGFNKKISLKNTELGKLIFSYDPYLENMGTLWLIHYLSASNTYLLVWNRVFSYASIKGAFNREDLIAIFTDLQDNISENTYKKHLRKEIGIVLDAYINQRLSKLGLLEQEDEIYHPIRNQDIPILILLASIIRFRDVYYKGASAIGINEICEAENSPGRLFFLDESFLRTKLEVMKSKSLIGIESRADLDQVRLGSDMTFEGVLERYYKSL